MHQGRQGTLVHKHEQPTQQAPKPKGLRDRQQHETEVDTEAGMLSGVSRKRSIRSNPCWFTEFCKSQCLSHFAAPFIVVRAETSVAESCKEAITVWRSPPTGNTSTTHKGLQWPDPKPYWFRVRPYPSVRAGNPEAGSAHTELEQSPRGQARGQSQKARVHT